MYLLFQNAFIFNPKGSDIYVMASTLKTLTKTEMRVRAPFPLSSSSSSAFAFAFAFFPYALSSQYFIHQCPRAGSGQGG
jgi:hypothetical protein